LREKSLAKKCAEAKASEEEREELQKIQDRLADISHLTAWPPNVHHQQLHQRSAY
jgi:hypothetical protein